MSDIRDLDDILNSFIGAVSPSKRRGILRRIAVELAKINKRRMASETSPDGQKWEKRKNPPRRGGSRKMMAGLRRNMQVKTSGDQASIGFYGRAGKIALVHHRGLSDAVSEGGPRIQYAMRELIGFADGDLDIVERIIIENLKF